MSNYVFAPAGPAILDSDESGMLIKCVEYIGSTQPGCGSKFSKGKRYLKYRLGCSGNAIKRALRKKAKVFGHDFQEYGIDVYYYHIDFCAKIVQEIISYINTYSTDEVKKSIFGGRIPSGHEYCDSLYRHRISQLRWVEAENYKNQRARAQDLIDSFDAI